VIALCELCGKQYRVDETAINVEKARFKCRSCGNFIFISNPNANSKKLLNAQGLPQSLPLVDAQTFEEDTYNNKKHSSVYSPPRIENYPEKKKKRGFSLVTKVICLMLIVSLMPFGTVWWVLIKQVSLQITQDTETLIDQVASNLVVHVNEWMDKNIRVLNALSEMEAMTSMDPAQQTPFLKIIQEKYPWMYLVFSTDFRGMNLARSDDKALVDYSDRQYYKDILAGNNLSWQVVIGKSSGKPALVIAVPIKKNGTVVGVLASAMTIDDISKRIANWKRGNSGFAFLVDETGKVIAHQNEEMVIQQKDLSNHPLIRRFANGKIGTFYYQDSDGKLQIGNVQGARYGWALAIQQSEVEAFEPLRNAQKFALILLITTVFFVILIAWYLARTIVRPIRELTDAAERISVGELDTEIKISSRDEIATLGDAISRMQDSIRLSVKRLRRRHIN
jgi:methyl-accepting chemotaxis protein